MKKIMFDAEFYGYRHCMAAVEDQDWGNGDWVQVFRHEEALNNLRAQVVELQRKYPGHKVIFCRGWGPNFRKMIYSLYKANRRDRRPPGGYSAFLGKMNTMAMHLGCEVWKLWGIEGDDIIGLFTNPEDIIVSGDKDMRTVAGLHLMPDGEIDTVTKAQADRQLYEQILIGDPADGYKGCPKVGQVAARKLLASCHTETEMWRKVLEAYLKAGLTEEYAVQMARCARILRKGEYDVNNQLAVLWEPPVT